VLRCQGASNFSLPLRQGTLVESLANPGDRRHFVRVRVDDLARIHTAGVQASHILSSLAEANGLVDVPPRTTLTAGTSVNVLNWE
jgi:molybdopterin biosynthesis enzyme